MLRLATSAPRQGRERGEAFAQRVAFGRVGRSHAGAEQRAELGVGRDVALVAHAAQHASEQRLRGDAHETSMARASERACPRSRDLQS